MAKLHELLAVESNLKGQAEKTRGELTTTFEKKRHLFSEKVATFKPTEADAPAVTEETLDLQSTVRKELAWISTIIAPALDTAYAVAEGNTQARADVVLESGATLLTGVPATALLELEKRADELHKLVTSIPTLDPAKGFAPDVARGTGIYVARPDVRQRTKKIVRPIVLVPPTVEHPAQAQLITEDVSAGTLTTQEWSGLLTPAEKGDMIERVEQLRRAVKRARSRANETDVPTTQVVGAKLLAFVFGQ